MTLFRNFARLFRKKTKDKTNKIKILQKNLKKIIIFNTFLRLITTRGANNPTQTYNKAAGVKPFFV